MNSIKMLIHVLPKICKSRGDLLKFNNFNEQNY